MSRKAIQVEYSPRVKELMEKELHRRQLEKHYGQRLEIIYYSGLGMANQEISKKFGCLEKTISKWRKRWKKKQYILTALEQGHAVVPISDRALMDKIKELLSDKPRSGAPSRITDAEVARIQALACEKPEKYGLPFTNWTHVELSNQAKRMGIIISPAHCGRILKKRFTTA